MRRIDLDASADYARFVPATSRSPAVVKARERPEAQRGSGVDQAVHDLNGVFKREGIKGFGADHAK
jgi:hypothetical protein